MSYLKNRAMNDDGEMKSMKEIEDEEWTKQVQALLNNDPDYLKWLDMYKSDVNEMEEDNGE